MSERPMSKRSFQIFQEKVFRLIEDITQRPMGTFSPRELEDLGVFEAVTMALCLEWGTPKASRRRAAR